MNPTNVQSDSKPTPWRKAATLVAVLTALLALYYLYGWFWQRSAVHEVLQIQEAFQTAESREWTPEQRKQNTQRLQYLQKNLSAGSKKDLELRGGRAGMKRVETHFDKILSLPRAELNKELDHIISQMEKARQDLEKRTADLQKKGVTAAPRGEGFKLDNQELANLLDQTNPELRAKFHQFVQEINKRRQERNLPPWQPFRAD